MTDNFEPKKMRDHFPQGYAELEVQTGVNRRKFLGLIGASMALAGVTTTGCIRRPKEIIYAESERPENSLPGVPKNYSTSAIIAGSVFGLSVTSSDGRPIKIDGNFKHPFNNPGQKNSIGSSNSFVQAEILNLYDPERGQNALFQGKSTPKAEVLNSIKAKLNSTKKVDGYGVAFVYGQYASPAFTHQLQTLQNLYPKALFVSQESIVKKNELSAIQEVTKQSLDVTYDISKANVILSLDSDFLGLEANNVKYGRQFSSNRQVNNENSSMNRLYCVESHVTTTGATADHRYTLSSNLMGDFLIAFMKELNVNISLLPNNLNDVLRSKTLLDPKLTKWIQALAKDFSSQNGRSLILVGYRQPVWIHSLALFINQINGVFKSGIGTFYPYSVNLKTHHSIADLKELSNKNELESILIISGNPVYSQPADVGFAEVIAKAKFSVYLNLFPDETAQSCQYYLPQSHFLEAWGDTITSDEIYSIRQPLIAPLFDECINKFEFISNLIDDKIKSEYEVVRNYLNTIMSPSVVDTNWRRYLSDGIVSDYPKSKPVEVNITFSEITPLLNQAVYFAPSSRENFHIDFVLDRSVYDGRFANNSWLQELPDSIYKLVWDNAILVSPKTAKALGVCAKPKPGKSLVDVLKVTYQNRTIEAAVWEVPGIPDFTIVFPLGYGRKFGQVSQNVGFNANLIRTSNSWMGQNVVVEKTDKTYSLVASQEQDFMNGTPTLKQDRPPVVREATLDQFKKDTKFVDKFELLPTKDQKSNLFEYPLNPTQAKWSRQQWGMTIDLNSCIGCNACTIACQAENNISVVGKVEVFKNREMSWIRIDRYFTGQVDSPDVQTVFQPMNCQQCENAPCEAVCPVAATTHSPDGLNDMAYNRCVGTRYCANNCPYKVRRYNFFNYSKIDDERNPLYAMQKNPNVTVRFRGVMEKCTYCVQKINAEKVKANRTSHDGLVPDGAIVTACQSVCPTNSIVFGDIANPQSLVSKMKSSPRNYSLLGELNTRPRTTYLAKLRNVNPEIG